MAGARAVYMLMALVAAHVWLCTLWSADRVSPPPRRPKAALSKCLVLTLNVSLRVVQYAPDLVCEPFLGERFNTMQWAMVSADAQAKLRRPELQSKASDLTNNQSVSIFANHAAVWRAVVAARQSVLVLEDDAVVTAADLHTLKHLLHAMRHERNFVLKLWNSAQLTNPRILSVWVSTWLLQWWKTWYEVPGHSAMLCVCDGAVRTAGAAAYVLDSDAARVLLRDHLPLTQHVDAYMHVLGCGQSKFNFSVVTPALASLSGRATQHKIEASWSLWKRHLNEIRYNFQNQNCKQ